MPPPQLSEVVSYLPQVGYIVYGGFHSTFCVVRVYLIRPTTNHEDNYWPIYRIASLAAQSAYNLHWSDCSGFSTRVYTVIFDWAGAVRRPITNILYKLTPFFCTPLLYQILTDFKSYFTFSIRRKFVVILWLKIPPHLVCRYTTLWNMSVS